MKLFIISITLFEIFLLVKCQQTGLITDAKLFVEQKVIKTFFEDCTIPRKLTWSSYEQAAWLASKTLPKLTFNLYTSTTNQIDFNIVNAAQQITSSSYFNSSLPTVIVIHGFKMLITDPNLRPLLTELISLGTHNVLTLDYKLMGFAPYYLASTNVRFVGETLGGVLVDMNSRGISNFHLIGFSLGAHVSGFAGKVYQSKTGRNLERITGLDAAGPCFFLEPSNKRLTSSDADFVDVIHTNEKIFGIDFSIGHVDFYPNGGQEMPNCFLLFCSHTKSLYYYKESIKNDNFLARTCTNYSDFISGKCTSNPSIHMGFWISTSVTPGNYYLTTSGTSPYSLGNNGIY